MDNLRDRAVVLSIELKKYLHPLIYKYVIEQWNEIPKWNTNAKEDWIERMWGVLDWAMYPDLMEEARKAGKVRKRSVYSGVGKHQPKDWM